jgi:hypothetical protein
MDVWRYSDWYGLGTEVRFSQPHIWRWRDWIIESLNADKGYDRMVIEMLAGDELAPEDPATLRATGFMARQWDVFDRNIWLANAVEHTARAFLGVTIQCARCHDHKFDPISQAEYYRLRAFFEPYHIRIDPVPGQPDRTKDGLPRAFDDFLDTPTYLFVRGDESRPDKKRPLTPGTPVVLGGGAVAIERVPLSVSASCPDKRPFVIAELLSAAEQEVIRAKEALGRSTPAAEQAARTLAALDETDRQAQAKFQAAAPGGPEAAKPSREAAVVAFEQRAKAQQSARESAAEKRKDETVLAVADARLTALKTLLYVERLEDEGAKKDGSAAWTDAALQAQAAQTQRALREAELEQLQASRALERATRIVEGLSATPIDPKDQVLPAALRKASGEAVDARTRLAAAETRLAQAQAAAKAPPTTAYTPRPMTFHRVKMTFADKPPNTPYRRESSGRRLALARWITDRRNPLTARVAVNQIWARHFGEPLSASTYDFGLRAERPVEHDLLDWLAVEFMESGWSMKRLHRLIVTSQAYRMRSSGGPVAESNAKIDPDNRYFWRMNARRMESEVIRDSLLALAGRLDPKMGGADQPVNSADAGTRRTIYYRYSRDDRIPLMVAFDAANVEECYRRHETIVPQQALAMTNSAMVLTRAGEIAAVIAHETGEADTAESRSGFVVAAFERVLGRAPAPAERDECERALVRLADALAAEKRAGVVPSVAARGALVHILLNHNDFLTIR